MTKELEKKVEKPSLTDILMNLTGDEEMVKSLGLFAIWPSPRQTPYKDSTEPSAPLDIFKVKSSTITVMEKTGTLRYDRRGMHGSSTLLAGDIIVHIVSGIFCMVMEPKGRDRVLVMSMLPPWDDEDMGKWRGSSQGVGEWVCMGQGFFLGRPLPAWFRAMPGIVAPEDHTEALKEKMPETQKENRQSWVEQGRMKIPTKMSKEDLESRENFIQAVHQGLLTETDFEGEELEEGEMKNTFIPTHPDAIRYMRELERKKKAQKQAERRKQKREGVEEFKTPHIHVVRSYKKRS